MWGGVAEICVPLIQVHYHRVQLVLHVLHTVTQVVTRAALAVACLRVLGLLLLRNVSDLLGRAEHLHLPEGAKVSL